MDKINDLKMLLSAELYLPMSREAEGDWFDLYERITSQIFDFEKSFITVDQVAKFIIQNPDYKSVTVGIIKRYVGNLDLDRFTVEACPSRFSDSDRIFLRGGNKRSIAYALRILEGEEFQPVKVCNWEPNFTRYDTRDLQTKCICWDL